MACTKSTQIRGRTLLEEYFSRKGAKTQKKAVRNTVHFAPLRLCARLFHPLQTFCAKPLTNSRKTQENGVSSLRIMKLEIT